MKLYGLAVAAYHKKDSSDLLTVICSPLAVSDGNRQSLEVLTNLAFQNEFLLTDQQALVDCMAKLSRIFNEVIKLQEESCTKHNIPYQPVSVEVGDNSRCPTDFSKIYSHILAAASATHNPLFADSCRTFHDALQKCHLKRGSFVKGDIPPDADIRNIEPEEFDIELGMLKQKMEAGCLTNSEHRMLTEISRKVGEFKGEQANENPFIFQMTLPDGYLESPEMQEKFPMHVFFHWHPDYTQAFYNGFQTSYKGPNNLHFKLPLDPPCPPFVDPCADSVCDQFDILSKQRPNTIAVDNSSLRKHLCALAQQIVDASAAQRTGNYWSNKTVVEKRDGGIPDPGTSAGF